MGRDDGDGDRHRGLEQVHHLLMGQGTYRVFTDLHQSAALPQPSLPGVAKVLNLWNNTELLEITIDNDSLKYRVIYTNHPKVMTFGNKIQSDLDCELKHETNTFFSMSSFSLLFQRQTAK